MILSLSFQRCKDEDGDIVTNGSEQVDNSHSGDGFDAPKTEEFDGGSITFQYNDNVIALEQSSYPYIVKVEADTIIYFSKSIPDKFTPYVGKIISSGVVDEKTPYGLGNKIVSVVEHDGLYECVTTNASLDEIFKELSLSADIGLITDTTTHSCSYILVVVPCYCESGRSESISFWRRSRKRAAWAPSIWV